MPFLGSSALQTSTANQEVVPSAPADWSFGYELKKFSFINDQDCTVTINGDKTVFLRAGQGCESDSEIIKSFVVVESGITFNWIGSY